MKVQYSDPAGTFLHTSTGKQVEVTLRYGHRPGTAEVEIGLLKLVYFSSERPKFLETNAIGLAELPAYLSQCWLQLSLPIQPPMALLANKTAGGMLGLRWSKVKLGCGSSAVVKTVQASHVGCGSNILGLQAKYAPCGLNVTTVQMILQWCRYSLSRQ